MTLDVQRETASPAPSVEVEITGLTEDGLGIAVVEGTEWLIPDVLPGERVSVLAARGRSRFKAVPELILDASNDRVTPRCEYFGLCGGCALQHVAARRQWRIKQDVLDAKLRGAGVQPETWLAPLAGPVWEYRRRARLGVKHVVRKGRVLVGFRERSKPYITVMDRCEILAPPVGRLLGPLAELIERLSISNRLPQIEVAVGDNAVALVFRVLDEPTPRDLKALEAFGAAHAVRICLQPAGLESIRGLRDYPEPLSYDLPDFGLSLQFEPADFLQVNGGLNRKMVASVVELLSPDRSQSILDLFCGIGNFSLPLATRAGRVVGIEGDPALVERARTNAARNRLDNAEFREADLFERPSGEQWMKERFDGVMLDPPRAGAEQVVRRLRELGARRIVYVSCHPETLARDAAILVSEQRYRLRAAGIMDMFPHTAHVESIAVFDREQ